MPMGGPLVLLQGGEAIKELIDNTSSWLYYWLDRARPWKAIDVSRERKVWVNFYGVPINSWGEVLFSKFLITFGKFIKMDEILRNMKQFDVAASLFPLPLATPLTYQFVS